MTIWGGQRVRLTSSCAGLPAGTEGTNRGQREGQPGAVTLLVELDDGRRVRLPLLALEPIEARYRPDGIAWQTSTPDAGEALLGARVGGVRYEVRGRSGRWFVTREDPTASPSIMRTPFYRNRRYATEVFNHLVMGY